MGVIVIIFLSLCLVFTSTVLALSVLPIDNNILKTGVIDIELGVTKDGRDYILGEENKLISEDEYLFEPGITVEKKFFIQNGGKDYNWEVYYKIYFANVKGELADELEITLKDENGNTYFSGRASEFVEENTEKVLTFKEPLEKGGRHYYIISFHYPENGSNIGQGKILEFDFCAKAVQSKNNPKGEFEYRG